MALPSKECLETFAFGGFNRTEENHERIWKAFSNDPHLSNLRTEVTMRMVNGEYDDEYTGERNTPLCNLTINSLPDGSLPAQYTVLNQSMMNMNLETSQRWTTAGMRTLQQCQRNHGVRMAKYTAQIGDRTAHLVHMYTNPAYWYAHYCIELRINSPAASPTTRSTSSRKRRKEKCRCTSV